MPSQAGLPVVDVSKLRFDKLAQRMDATGRDRERSGAIRRVREGRITEPLPVAGKTQK